MRGTAIADIIRIDRWELMSLSLNSQADIRKRIGDLPLEHGVEATKQHLLVDAPAPMNRDHKFALGNEVQTLRLIKIAAA